MHVEKSKYEIPKGYFDAVENEVLQKVGLTPQKSSSANIKPLWYWVGAVAASLLLVLAWPSSQEYAAAYEVTYTDLAYLYGVDEFDMMEVLTEDEIEDLTEDFGAFSSEESDAAWEYIMNDVDEENIYEFL
jgi:hypothetical protein